MIVCAPDREQSATSHSISLHRPLRIEELPPWGERGEQALPGAPNLKQVLSELSQLGISHILDVRFGGSSYELPDHPPGLTLVFERPDQRIYRVNSSTP